MNLTDTAIKAATADGKPRKLSDGDGLYLLVQPSGSKLWRFKYHFGGVEKLISFGAYPDVSLKAARAKRTDARSLVADGKDPSAARRASERASAHTFNALALEFIGEQAQKLSESTVSRMHDYLGHLKPLHSLPIEQIEVRDVLDALTADNKVQRINDTVHRAKAFACRVFRHARAKHRLQVQLHADDFRDSIVRDEAQPHAGLTDPKEVGGLLRAIDAYRGQPSTWYALRLAPLLFLRPGELRVLEWSWIDMDAAMIRVPGPVMKMDEPHMVPLSRQALTILAELKKLSGSGRYLFPSWGKSGVLSEGGLNFALLTMGYGSDRHTPHGFRTTATVLQAEMKIPPELTELQLAHRESNKVRGSYLGSKKVAHLRRMDERREMMQQWADKLDELRGA